MKVLLIGLGNPGRQYEKSRHNAGFCFIDAVLNSIDAEKIRENSYYILWQIKNPRCTFFLAKPLTYMNLSGKCLAGLQRRTGIGLTHTCVICDNMDLACGRAKMKFSGGSGGQKGLQNIIDLGGSRDFWRLFIGVGRPVLTQDVPGYVLGRFPSEQEAVFLKLCSDLAQIFLEKIYEKSFTGLQQIINSL